MDASRAEVLPLTELIPLGINFSGRFMIIMFSNSSV